MEAALHMDAKDAAKIVYEAVWADTSDPNATYLNAAKALLSELHKRAGIGLLLGEHQPLGALASAPQKSGLSGHAFRRAEAAALESAFRR